MFTYPEWVSEPQSILAQLTIIFGWAMVPFLLSVIYGCTKCGDRKIPWIKDILAMIVGIGALFVTQKVVGQILLDRSAEMSSQISPHWFLLGANFAAFFAMAVVIPLVYRVLYAGMPEPAPAHH